MIYVKHTDMNQNEDIIDLLSGRHDCPDCQGSVGLECNICKGKGHVTLNVTERKVRFKEQTLPTRRTIEKLYYTANGKQHPIPCLSDFYEEKPGQTYASYAFCKHCSHVYLDDLTDVRSVFLGLRCPNCSYHLSQGYSADDAKLYPGFFSKEK